MKDNKFSFEAWNAVDLKTPSELREYLESKNLAGKKVRRFKLVGLCYDLTRDFLEDQAYRILEDLPEEERAKLSDYDNIPSDAEFSRYAMIDEPLLIEFTDGDRLELDVIEESWYRANMNSVPWDAEAAVNIANTDANVLLAPLINDTVKGIEVGSYKTKTHPMYMCAFDDGKEHELISELVIIFESGNQLVLTAQVDYGVVFCADADNNIMTIPFGELKKGLCNYEDREGE